MSASTWKRPTIGALLAGAALVLLASGASAAGSTRPREAGWRSFVSRAGRFQVELPAAPVVVRDQARATLVGAVVGTTYTARSGDLVLAVEVRDLPPLARTLVPRDTILEETRAGVAADVHAVEVRGGEALVQGFHARDFVYRLPGEPPVFERALVVLAGGRLYVVTGRAAGRPDSSPAVERFFGSFRLWREADEVPPPTPAALHDAAEPDARPGPAEGSRRPLASSGADG